MPNYLHAFTVLFLAAAASAQTIPGIGPTGPIQRPFTGFMFTEGPAQDANGDLYFSDVRANNVHKVDTQGNLTTFLPNAQGPNGIVFTRTGRMILCQSGAPGRMVEVDVATKAIRVLAGVYNSNPFNGPNDVCADVHDGIWFTDPNFNSNSQDRQGVYYIDPVTGTTTRVVADLIRPNGIRLSPREDVLYVASSTPAALMAYPVLGPGQLGAGQQLYQLGTATVDGMAVDTKGNIYLCRPGLIDVITPQGVSLGTFTVAESPSNCTFGGPNLQTLWITARTSLYRADMLSTGYRPMRLVSDKTQLPVAGGAASFQIQATPFDASRVYLVIAGISGTSPGIVVENTRIPMQVDGFTVLALELLNSVYFPANAGVLDAAGYAKAGFFLPPVDAGIAGTKVSFAGFKLGPIDGASNAVTITITL